MSRTHSRKVRYTCWNDHSLTEPCGGHEVQIEYFNTVDTVSVLVDGKPRIIVDQGLWDAIRELVIKP